MKSFTRVMLIVAGSLLVLGGVVCLIAGANSGFSYNNFRREIEKNEKNYQYEDFDQTFAGEYTSIDFQFAYSDLIVEEGDVFSIHAVDVVKDTLRIDDGGRTLSIKQKTTGRYHNNWFGFFDFGWHDDGEGSWDFGPRNARVTITIPAGSRFDRAYLALGTGESTISNISAKDLKIDGGVGNSNLYDLTADVADINCGVSDSTFDNAVFGDATIETGIGSLTLRNSAIDGLELNVGVGDFEFEGALTNTKSINGGVGSASIKGIFTGDTRIFAGVGDIELEIIGNEADYDFEVNNGIGDATFNGRDNHFPMNNNAQNKITIDGGVGSVSVEMRGE